MRKGFWSRDGGERHHALGDAIQHGNQCLLNPKSTIASRELIMQM